MADVDLIELRHLYTDASRVAFRELHSKNPGEQFYAAALYSDNSAMTVVPAMNSEQSLQRTIDRYVELFKTKGWPVPDHGYLRWCPDEWPYHGARPEIWDAASKLHEEFNLTRKSDEQFLKFRNGVFQMMIDILHDLDSEELFEFNRRETRMALMVWVGDFEEARNWWLRSVKVLNSPSICERAVRDWHEP